MKKVILVSLLLIISWSYSQTITRPVLTGAPFLRIAPDARAGGVGDQGVATSPDNFSEYWNAAKYVFSEEDGSIGVSYTPYMSKLTDDVFLLNAAYHQYLTDNKNSALGISISYFNLGKMNLSSITDVGDIINEGEAHPNEFSAQASYSLRLTDKYSMAVSGKYIRSDLDNNVRTDDNLKAATSFAADIAGYYQSNKFESFGSSQGKMRFGFQVANIGGKLDYSDSEDTKSYLPTNLRLGTSYDWYMDTKNSITLGLEFAKLLVPTPENVYNSSGQLTGYKMPDESVVSGIFSSFGDAPDGFSEEMKEWTYSIAAEYNYNNSFMFRAGYFHESPEKGDRQYITMGTGLRYSDFGLDVSYLFTTGKINSALDNTLRFTLSWNFGGQVSQASETN